MQFITMAVSQQKGLMIQNLDLTLPSTSSLFLLYLFFVRYNDDNKYGRG